MNFKNFKELETEKMGNIFIIILKLENVLKMFTTSG